MSRHIRYKKKEERGGETGCWKDAPILHGSQTHLQRIYYLTALQNRCSPHIVDASWRAEREREGEQTETQSDGDQGDIKQSEHSEFTVTMENAELHHLPNLQCLAAF